jgi:O-antigen/teichoic acid export membrane protein
MVDARYAAGAAVIALISLSYVFLGMAYYFQLGMFLASRTSLIGLVSAGAAVFNLALNYVLIRRFGMIGAAWATVLGFLAIAVGNYYSSERVFPLRLPVGRAARALAIAIALYLVAQVLPSLSSLAFAFICKSVLILAFPVLLWVGGCFDKDELATLNSLRLRALKLLAPAWAGI